MHEESLPAAVTVPLSGRIDSGNARETEERIFSLLGSDPRTPVVLDAAGLEYISSAGLRVILRVKKARSEVSMINVSSEVYEILEMTGFTEMMPVARPYRTISLDGCVEIGRGANGAVYRMGSESVVKVYYDADALDDIKHEREMARLALILGIPTAISYDVVKVGDSFGAVFEMLNARSLSGIIAEEPEKLDWCVDEYVAMLKTIHGTEAPAGKLPDMREDMIGRARFMLPHMPEAEGEKLVSLMEGLPADSHLLHGDFHTNNLELQNGEVLLIDMDTLAVGRPILEFGPIFNAYKGFSELDHSIIERFQGFDYDTSSEFFRRVLMRYFGTGCGAKLREIEHKARIIGYTRLLRRSIRNGEYTGSEQGKREFAFRMERLLELVNSVDELDVDPNELTVDAEPGNLPDVQAFIAEKFAAAGGSPAAGMQMELAAEEIFINIASYAYAPGHGRVSVRAEAGGEPKRFTVTFTDGGRPYDPLKAAQPDVTLPGSERPIGGLGIFITLKSVDDAAYEYRGGKNILTLRKYL